MKILVDARHMEGSCRGIANYLRGMLLTLSNIDKTNFYILFVRNKVSVESLQLGKNFTFYECNCSIGVCDVIVMPYLINYKIKPEIVWFPANNCCPFLKKEIKVVSTIQDIMFYTLKYPFMSKQYFGSLYRRIFSRIAIKRSDKINTTTLVNIQLISDFFHIDSSRFFCTYMGLSSIGGYDDTILERLSLNKGRYFYTITGTSPNKNLPALLEAFLIYCRQYGEEYKLVVTGVNTDALPTKYRNIASTGFVTNEQKQSLLKNCALFLFLSKEEGFGIPPMEAIAQNCNILLSQIPTLKELYSDCASFTVSDNVAKIADDIYHVLQTRRKYNANACLVKFNWLQIGKIFYNEVVDKMGLEKSE